MTDFTDEDVQRGVDALAASRLFGSQPEVVCVLAAVLPAYAKRVRAEALREAADWMESPAGAYDPEIAKWLRARADQEENEAQRRLEIAKQGRCPDCGMRGWHAADHYGWPEEDK
jgi:hypothetical protein